MPILRVKMNHMNLPNKELQEAFGKVVYAVAKIDGEVQQTEIDVLHKIIAKNKWAEQVLVSFNKETELDNDPNKIFPKAMNVFRSYGKSEHYTFFIELLEEIASAHGGIVPEEQKLIKMFKDTLDNFIKIPSQY